MPVPTTIRSISVLTTIRYVRTDTATCGGTAIARRPHPSERSGILKKSPVARWVVASYPRLSTTYA
eukprot:3934658-Rhodomonas_salina.1